MTTAIETKDTGILFSGEMVRAIIDCRKRQTRRILRHQPPEGWRPLGCERYHPAIEDDDGWIDAAKKEIFGAYDEEWGVACPYGGPGDRLWVRETWAVHECYDELPPCLIPKIDEDHPDGQQPQRVWYLADSLVHGGSLDRGDNNFMGKTRVSIHMPRWASRSTLENVDVRIEQIQSLSFKDWVDDFVPSSRQQEEALASFVGHDNQKRMSKELWDRINGAGAWARNNWVWAITFKRVG